MDKNLKNRPKWAGNPEPDGEVIAMQMDDWFDGFEKELREILREDRQMGRDLFPSEGEKKLAKEILGEE